MASKRVVALPSEDVGAVVVDIGSHETRAGFAGEDSPKCLFPSFLGMVLTSADDVSMTGAIGEEPEKSRRKVGAAELSYRRDDMELKSPFDAEGIPSDLSVVQALLQHAFSGRLLCDVSEHPVLLVEPSWNTSACREQLTELVFEQFAPPGLFVSKTAVLATFMNARASAVVLDSGHLWSSAVPVHEGYVLKKCIQRSPVAGARVNQDLLSFLERESGGAPVHPQYACSRKVDPADGSVKVTLLDFPRTHPSYRHFAVDQVIRDLKENTCRVSETDYSDAEYEKVAAVPYELPDGRVVQMGGQRFKSAELLFKPDLYAPGHGGDAKGMHELVYAAIQVLEFFLFSCVSLWLLLLFFF
jgi:actin-like protein 6A